MQLSLMPTLLVPRAAGEVAAQPTEGAYAAHAPSTALSVLVSSARHGSHNLVVFMGRSAAASLERLGSETVDWSAWKRRRS